MKKKRPTGTAKSIPAGIGIGLLVSLICTLALAALAAYLILAEITPQDSIGYWAIGILLVSTITGSLTAVRYIQRLKLQMSFLSAGCYFALLLAITALFFGGQYQGMGTTAVTVFAGAAASAGVGMLNKKERKHSYKKRVYR